MDYVMVMVNLRQVVSQLYMRVNGRMDYVMVRERLFLKVVQYMRVNFNMVINRVRVKWYIQHKIIIRVNFKMIKNVEMGQWIG